MSCSSGWLEVAPESFRNWFKKWFQKWRQEFGVAEFFTTIVVVASTSFFHSKTETIWYAGIAGDGAEYAAFYSGLFFRWWWFAKSAERSSPKKKAVTVLLALALDLPDSICRSAAIACVAFFSFWLAGDFSMLYYLILIAGVLLTKFVLDVPYYLGLLYIRSRIIPDETSRNQMIVLAS